MWLLFLIHGDEDTGRRKFRKDLVQLYFFSFINKYLYISWTYNLPQVSSFECVQADLEEYMEAIQGKKNGENILSKRNSMKPKYGDKR